jgi:signal transduction histidine kinase
MILMMSFTYDLVDRQGRFLIERARARTLHQAGVLASGCGPQIITRDLAGLQEMVDSVARDSTISHAAVTDPNGRIYADSDPQVAGMYLQDALSQHVLSGPAEPTVYNEGGASVSAAVPIMAGGSLLGWAWLTGDLSSDNQQLASMRRTGLIYVGIAITSGAILAILVANLVTRQLRLLLGGARRMAEDKLDEPVPIIANNDVGVVAQAFNKAMERLAAERAQLVNARNELEAEVRERRRAEDRLRAANAAITSANENLNQFAYAVSHDLQEPLRAVRAYSQLLPKKYNAVLDEEGREFLGYIHDGAERMQNLIKALLKYSRSGAPGGEEPAVVDTNDALATALENLAAAIEDTGAEVRAVPLPRVRAHAVAVAQLFQNLIGNAIKYSGPRKPLIAVAADQNGCICTFAVKDNGIGIPADQQGRIFKIFKRAHAEEYPGEGVGLAICSKIVEHYGGRIWVESQEGEGSTFRFTLPAA